MKSSPSSKHVIKTSVQTQQRLVCWGKILPHCWCHNKPFTTFLTPRDTAEILSEQRSKINFRLKEKIGLLKSSGLSCILDNAQDRTLPLSAFLEAARSSLYLFKHTFKNNFIKATCEREITIQKLPTSLSLFTHTKKHCQTGAESGAT